jgi:hypothetical protein
MGTTNFGNQIEQIKFNAPADSISFTRLLQDVILRGIYKGGYLTKVDNVTVNLSALTCIIGDDFYQVNIRTTTLVTLTVGSAIPYVVLRWVYSGVLGTYMDVLAVASGSVQGNDLIVGKCVFSGSTLTGFDYADSVRKRSTPQMAHVMLRVEPTDPATMTVRIRAGRCNYGTANLEVAEQVSSAFVAPATNNYRIDVIYVDTDGVVKVYTGTPTTGTPTAPAFNSKKVLAQIYLAYNTTSIIATNITDVRSFI